MKPARGSNRAASNVPKVKNKRKTTDVTTKRATGKQELSEKSSQPKPAQKRKAVGSSSVPKKVKEQEHWQLLPRSSITALENIMDLSVLFLDQCTDLRVPGQKQKDSERSSHRQQEETKKAVAGKKTLETLERKMIPDSDSQATARRLGDILQKSEAIQNAQVLLLHAYRHVDQLFNTGFTTTSGAPCSGGT
ncbi:hypothetical protein F2P81_004414 [Scophthalmus maximus]|uniref:Centromere protein Q n=1 Tax=Scophthalmus maximus TaxID=52904 RepID=A0A6A4T9L9_SCOMX|nr:hypothetical protein F2P81_004414 [Scophthalmus maximus]